MFFDSISIIFFVCPSLLSSASVIIYLESEISCNFVPANVGYNCGNVFLFIVFSIYKEKIPKRKFDLLSNIIIFLSLMSELTLFLFYEIQFYRNDRKIENFLIFSRTTFLILKILVFNKLLNFSMIRISNLIGMLLIFQIILFILTGIEINFNNILILFFQTISIIFIVVALFQIKKYPTHSCCRHCLFSEIFQNLKLNLLVIEKTSKGNKIAFGIGLFSNYFIESELKNEKLLANSINLAFYNLNLERQMSKSNKSFSNKKKISFSVKETPKDEMNLNLNEIIEEISKSCLEKKKLKYPVCFKFDMSKLYKLIIQEFKIPNNPNEFYTLILSNENKKERISQLEMIVESNKRFFSSFSHELKTPINGSLPLIEMVRISISTDIRNSELLEIAIGSIKLLHNSIDNILNFYLFESGQFIINASNFWLRDLIDEIKSIISPIAMVKNIQLNFKIGENFDRLKIYTDYEKLRQLLLNLSTNAIQFTNTGTVELLVEVKSDNPLKMNFIIKDTGIGIDEFRLSNLNKLLIDEESFFEKQINSSGSCLGLLICQRIIFLLGGEQGLEIKSQLGLGSEFSFFIDGGIILKSKNIAPFHDLTFANSYNELVIKARMNTCLIEKEKKKNKSMIRITYPIIKTTRTDGSKQSHNVSSRLSHNSMDFNEKLHYLYNFDISLNFDKINDDKCEKSEGVDSDLIMKDVRRRNSELTAKSLIFRKETTFDFGRKRCDCVDVLVVDDDAFNLLSIELMLKSFNLKCLKVMAGVEAIEKLKKLHNSCEHKCKGIKLIFMDYQMPIMDGLQTTTEIMNLIKKNEINDIPIIGCTAFISKDKILDCLEIGMKDVIFKPITRNVIKRIIEEWLPLVYSGDIKWTQ